MEEQNNQISENQESVEEIVVENPTPTVKIPKNIIIIGAIGGAFVALAIVTVLMFALFKHEHNWGEWQVAKAVTCVQDGVNTRACDGCDETQSMTFYATGHTFGDWSIAQNSTCTANGFEERVCSCGEKEKRELSARGYHVFGEWYVAQ